MSTAAFAAEVVPAEPPAQLLSVRIQLVEMHPGAAIAGGYLDAKAIAAGNAGGTRITILTPAKRPTALTIDELVAEQGAKVIADIDYGTASGQPVAFTQLVEAPFELLREERIADESAAEFDLPGMLGLAVRVTPTLDEQQRVTLEIETMSRSAETWTSAGQTQSTQRRLLRTAQRFALAVVADTTVAIAPAMSEEDRRDLAELGLADPAAQPFFAEPELGWTLYLLITPSVIEDS